MLPYDENVLLVQTGRGATLLELCSLKHHELQSIRPFG
jgi:hypothetical protein